MTPKKIEEMFERFKKANPDPRSDLQFNSPYELLVAVMLSAQATDISVNKATEKLYPVANTPESIIALGVEGLKSYVNTTATFPQTGKRLKHFRASGARRPTSF